MRRYGITTICISFPTGNLRTSFDSENWMNELLQHWLILICHLIMHSYELTLTNEETKLDLQVKWNQSVKDVCDIFLLFFCFWQVLHTFMKAHDNKYSFSLGPEYSKNEYISHNPLFSSVIHLFSFSLYFWCCQSSTVGFFFFFKARYL